ncbi:DNA repair exonuclease [Candidatus Woesearchaeota archaeon]|jgi:DNA repair exonuclease SbcCD nuclease subunit|nr:DNA repair exonuclease [Candidatus Woesearchaeota archaeon]MBT7062865.1 DNA repair exonuclease [Candidatus Woesearchaeota archaeon]MBT7402993.1 DNA repair exonuclease [Candidatus Woesearchaeota archaeon]
MRIAVISDLHLGFKFGEERGEDAFRNANEAFSKALEEKVNLILLPGDIFHDKVPRPEIIGRAIELFARLNKIPKIKVINLKSKEKDEMLNQEIPAIVTIYGTHERRNSESINPVQLLEKAGFLTYLHAESSLIEIGTERIGIHGLSGVPDQFAVEAMEKWNPKPFPQVPNVLMIHQTFKELIPDVKENVMSYANLPPGFNLFLLGHIHWNVEDKHPFTETPIIVPGSTIRTQLRKIEAERAKGFYIIESNDNKINIKFKELENVRKFYYRDFDVSNTKPSEVITSVQEKISAILKTHTKKMNPIIRFKLKGALAEGFLPTDLNFISLSRKFSEKALLYFDKSKVQSSQLGERAKLLYDLKQKKVSIEEIGMKLLLENMKVTTPKQAKDVQEMFEKLVEGVL